MGSKKPADLLAELDSLGAGAAARPPKSTRTPRPGQQGQSSQTEQDLLAELGSLAQRPASRPGTPSLKPNPSATGSKSPKRDSTATPPQGRSSEEKSNGGAGQRKSGDSTRSLQPTFTPATTTTEESPEPTPPAPQPVKAGGGWWGGILSTATAAVSQAQAAVREIQQSEDAQRYLEQVKGNVGALRGLGNYAVLVMRSRTNDS